MLQSSGDAMVTGTKDHPLFASRVGQSSGADTKGSEVDRAALMQSPQKSLIISPRKGDADTNAGITARVVKGSMGFAKKVSTNLRPATEFPDGADPDQFFKSENAIGGFSTDAPEDSFIAGSFQHTYEFPGASVAGILVLKKRTQQRKANCALRYGMFYIFSFFEQSDNLCVSIFNAKIKANNKGLLTIRTDRGVAMTFQSPSMESCGKWYTALTSASKKTPQFQFQFGKMLGSGCYSEVRMGTHKRTGRQAAIKVINKDKADKELVRSIRRELMFIGKVLPPEYICQTLEVFDAGSRIYLVLEMMNAGTVYEAFDPPHNRFKIDEVKYIMTCLLKGLVDCHAADIVHRDVKPENILCHFEGDELLIKVADFGLCDLVTKDKNGEMGTRGKFGTPYYVAPEVACDLRYNTQADMWSCGVLMYKLLSGIFPFEGDGALEVLMLVREGKYSFQNVDRYMTEEAKDLITELLTYDPSKRPTARDALKHPFFADEAPSSRLVKRHSFKARPLSRKNSAHAQMFDEGAGWGVVIDDDQYLAEM